jgi:hypothetical protein
MVKNREQGKGIRRRIGIIRKRKGARKLRRTEK